MNEPLSPSTLDPAGSGALRLGLSTLGEILDRTVHLYRSRFLLYLGISLLPTALVVVPAVVFVLLLVWLGSLGAGSAAPAVAGVAGVILFAVLGLLALPVLVGAMALAAAAMNHAVSLAYLGGKTTIREAYKFAWRQGWRYSWLLVLEGLIVWVAPIAVWIALVAISAGAAAWAQSAGVGSIASGALFGLAVFLVVVGLLGYLVWMLLRLSLAFPACVIEQIGAWDAIKRSSTLSSGTKGRIFLLYLLGVALNWILSMGITLPMTIIMSQLPNANDPKHATAAGIVMLIVIYGAGIAIQALTKPIYGIALTLFYYDQRIRQEGFDIEWMMQRAGMIVPPAIAAETTQPINTQPTTETVLPAEGESI
jgi:hypothetical protein